ncbi:MAG: class II glutamine amidotransferase, partial [Myxococcales bacterium]|nr:class II glutamine amidotransferase [Myxococcales bacterium]
MTTPRDARADGAPPRDDADDAPKEACGVFGIWAPGADVARVSFFALYALQHRGQESAGIATVGESGEVFKHKGMGLVTQVFNEANLAPLVGTHAVAHTRYSTTGSSSLRNAQPYLLHTSAGPLAVAHNGNLVNAAALRAELLGRGVGLVGESDSEVMTQLLAAPAEAALGAAANSWEARLANLMRRCEGAFSVAVLTKGAVYALRDPQGFRPLCIGSIEYEGGAGRGFVVASESSAFGTIGAKFLRDVAPGEIVRLDKDGVTSLPGAVEPRTRALCVFEYVYFARPDSLFEGQMV